MCSCQLETIAQSKTTVIQFCSECEEIHLIMGPISLRLSKDLYQRFASDIAQGLEGLNSITLSSDIFAQLDTSRFHS